MSGRLTALDAMEKVNINLHTLYLPPTIRELRFIRVRTLWWGPTQTPRAWDPRVLRSPVTT